MLWDAARKRSFIVSAEPMLATRSRACVRSKPTVAAAADAQEFIDRQYLAAAGPRGRNDDRIPDTGAGMTAGGVISNFSAVQALGQQAQATLLALFGQALARVPAALLAVIVIFITSSVARVATRSSTAVGARILRSPSLRILFSKAAAVGVWLIGMLIASLLLFPGLRLGDVVATLGLGSVAIGFAFQDIFKNFLAGILLLVNEPFRIGDTVVIENYEGVVTHIDIRTTNVRTYTGDLVLIPNSIVFTSSVQVRTAYPQRRTDLVVGVAYATNLGAAIELARTTLVGVEGIVAEPAVVVDATAFGDSAIDLTMRYWTNSEKQQVLRTQTRVLVALKAAFDRAGIEIPFPIRTLVLPERQSSIFSSDNGDRP